MIWKYWSWNLQECVNRRQICIDVYMKYVRFWNAFSWVVDTPTKILIIACYASLAAIIYHTASDHLLTLQILVYYLCAYTQVSSFSIENRSPHLHVPLQPGWMHSTIRNQSSVQTVFAEGKLCRTLYIQWCCNLQCDGFWMCSHRYVHSNDNNYPWFLAYSQVMKTFSFHHTFLGIWLLL